MSVHPRSYSAELAIARDQTPRVRPALLTPDGYCSEYEPEPEPEPLHVHVVDGYSSSGTHRHPTNVMAANRMRREAPARHTEPLAHWGWESRRSSKPSSLINAAIHPGLRFAWRSCLAAPRAGVYEVPVLQCNPGTY